MLTNVPIALTIAGSDSGGGAGLQADLRTFSFHCVHGASVVTCVTAQNTQGVTRVDAMTSESVTAQIEAVLMDLRVGAFKTGMLLNVEIMKTVARKITAFGLGNFVLDPVMVSRTGAKLIAQDAMDTIVSHLIPLAAIITPNRYEAQILANMSIENLADMKTAAQKIHQLGCRHVLVKGGGMEQSHKGVDVWYDGNDWEVLTTELIDTPHTHGTGCTLAAAITANLAQGKGLHQSVIEAKNYVTNALRFSLAIGHGQGPVGHFYQLCKES
jgi:hydroxymethylpyrimidine/phosphomethylpyrimidine kinase